MRVLLAPLLVSLLGAPGWLAAESAPETGRGSDPAAQAAALMAGGHAAEALAILEPWVAQHPDDRLARQTMLAARVSLLEAEIRGILDAQARGKDVILADSDYQAAKARSQKDVARRLDIVEYLLAQDRPVEAVQACNAILSDHVNEPATLNIKFRILNRMVEREREALLKDRDVRHAEGINDVVRDSTFPRDKPKLARTVWTFDEDIEAAERERVRVRLQERITLIYDGSNGTTSSTLKEILPLLFGVAGVNYVVLDSALSEEKITIHLVDETVENALATLAKLVKLRYNYTAGTVFIGGEDDDVMISKVIRLASGLTDVETDLPMDDFDPGNGGAGGGANGGQGRPQAQQQQQGGQQGQPRSDLERLIKSIPDIVPGWKGEFKFHLDRKSNTLMVKATPWAVAEVERLLAALDYNSVQVLIESRFIEIGDEAARELGIDWQAAGQFNGFSFGGNPQNPNLPLGPNNPPGNVISTGGVSSVYPLATLSEQAANGLKVSGLYSAGNFAIGATLHALEQAGKVNTLSEPKILTLNNAQGVIQLLREVPYIEDYESRDQSTQTPVSNPNNTTNYITTTVLVPKYNTALEGISLKIRPSVARNSDVITITIQPVVKELLGITEAEFSYNSGQVGTPSLAGKVQKPYFSTRKLATALHVKNGQTVALGGLVLEKDFEGTSGVPGLSKLPLLGSLFRRDTKTSQRRNLVIIVTARLIDPSGAQLSDEIRRLRDTSRVVLPEDVRKEMDARDAAAAKEAAAAVPAEGPVRVPPPVAPRGRNAGP